MKIIIAPRETYARRIAEDGGLRQGEWLYVNAGSDGDRLRGYGQGSEVLIQKGSVLSAELSRNLRIIVAHGVTQTIVPA